MKLKIFPRYPQITHIFPFKNQRSEMGSKRHVHEKMNINFEVFLVAFGVCLSWNSKVLRHIFGDRIIFSHNQRLKSEKHFDFQSGPQNLQSQP